MLAWVFVSIFHQEDRPHDLLKRETEADQDMVAVVVTGESGTWQSVLDTRVGSREGWPPAAFTSPKL